MTSSQRVAVVGCGYWGRNLVRNFAELGALAAVVDSNPTVGSGLSAQYGVPALNLSDVLGDASIDAVATASPAQLHHAIAVQALQSGKHVFVEKPIALSLEEGREMRDVARRVGRALMVGHLLQYHPAYLKLKELVAEGAIGRVRYLYSNRLSLGKLRTEEDVVWSFAPHDVSMILGIAGERPAEVVAHGATLVSTNLADSAHVHLSFPSGLTAHVFVSWLSPFKEQRFVAVGEAGSLVFDDTRPWAEKLTLTRHSLEPGPALAKGEVARISVTEAEPLREECRHFLDCIASGSRPRTDADEALAVLDVLVRASPTAFTARS